MSPCSRLQKAREHIRKNEYDSAMPILDEIIPPGQLNFLDVFNPIKKEAARQKKDVC